MRNKGSTEIWEELTLQIVEALHARLGIRPARVVFLKRHGIPRTYNGKIQHVLLKEQFLSGKLKEDALILYPDY
jgi:acyl-coenzyme A synthetase/AMP-(fatty) acid ligase